MSATLETALKAMIEQAGVPAHHPGRCGTNDCPACEWLAIAADIGWPLWGIPHKFEGPDSTCEACGQPHNYELHL